MSDIDILKQQIIKQEHLAEIGRLSAGIAHEIKNPLTFILNFSKLSTELLDDLLDVLGPAIEQLDDENRADAQELVASLKDNLWKICKHGDRADNIVRSMLQYSRGVEGEKVNTDVNQIVEETLNLSYHGMRATDSTFNITMDTHYDAQYPRVYLVPQDISRTLLNIFSNAFFATHEKKQGLGDEFSPTLTVETVREDDGVLIRITDNGPGIPEDIRSKIFDEFFTTKSVNDGTGLGLAMAYDIVVNRHKGRLDVESVPGESTTFTIFLPRNA